MMKFNPDYTDKVLSPEESEHYQKIFTQIYGFSHEQGKLLDYMRREQWKMQMEQSNQTHKLFRWSLAIIVVLILAQLYLLILSVAEVEQRVDHIEKAIQWLQNTPPKQSKRYILNTDRVLASAFDLTKELKIHHEKEFNHVVKKI